MNSKKLFLGVALLLALGLTACGGNKTSEGGKSELESSVEEESSSKRSRSSRSSTEPEPEPVIDSELFCEENKTWLEQHFDKLYYWNDQNWCGSLANMTHAELDKDGVYHYAWKTDEGSGSCDYSVQFFFNKQDAVPGQRYVAMFNLVASGAVTGADFTLVYADDGTQNPGLKEGLNEIRYAFTQSERPQSDTDYFGASISFHFSAEVAREKEFSIDVSDIRIYLESEAPVPAHEHKEFEDVAHEKGEGEVAETIKKCKEDEYYEIKWNALDTAATSEGWTNGKLGATGNFVEFKFWAPKAMTARIYANAKYNKSNIKGVGTSEHHTVWYDVRPEHDGFKVQPKVNGVDIDQSTQSVLIDGKEISLKDLNFPDLGYQDSSDEILLMPWIEVELVEGVNTLRLTRLNGYGHTYSEFIIKGEAVAEPAVGDTAKEWTIDEIVAGRTEATWGDTKDFGDDIKGFKFNVANNGFTLKYTPKKDQVLTFQLYVAVKESNKALTGFWEQDGTKKTEVKCNTSGYLGAEPDFSGVVASTLNDNGIISLPIWINVFTTEFKAEENTITVTYLTGGYSYYICGARLIIADADVLIGE